MDCKEFKNIVADLFDKEVSPETRKVCNEHVSHCAECREYYEDLLSTADLLRPMHSPVSQNSIAPTPRWLKIAAMFIGVLFISGIAFAAIHMMHQSQKPTVSQTKQTANVTKPVNNVPADTITTDTLFVELRVFDNVPLDTMLNEMASFYQIAIEFQREESRQLRFHFKWKRSESIDRVVDRLNNFEAVTIVREPEKLIVK